MLRLIDTVRPGSRVTIVTPQGQQRTGRAVMPCSAGGWVLNMGGAHGTPGIADDSNTVKVRAPKEAKLKPAACGCDKNQLCGECAEFRDLKL